MSVLTARGRRTSPAPQQVALGVHLVTFGRGAAGSNVYLVRSGSTWTLIDAGWYLPQYAMPLDRWLVAPLMRLLPAGTRARIEEAGSITDVVRPLDRQGGVPGLPEWVWLPTPGTPRVTSPTCGQVTGP
jgi:hypothetical protein